MLKTLESYIRTEEKDRLHSINHYRHLLRSAPDTADQYRPELLKRLADIDLRLNATIDMLSGAKNEVERKIKPVACEFELLCVCMFIIFCYRY